MDGCGIGGGCDFGGGAGVGFSSGGVDFGCGVGFSSVGGTDFGGTDFNGGGLTTSSHDIFGYNHGHDTLFHPTADVGFIPGPDGGYTETPYTPTNNFGQLESNMTVFGAQPTTVYQPTRPYNSSSFTTPVMIMFLVFFVISVIVVVLIPVMIFTSGYR